MTDLLDLDSHLQLTEAELAEIFGADASVLPGQKPAWPAPAATSPTNAIDPEAVWQMKGSGAPGASVAADRVRVLDAMGVRRQLVLPRVRVALAAWRAEPTEGMTLVRRYNDFIAAWQRPHPDRLHASGILDMRDPDKAVVEATRAARLGLRAMLLPCNEAPAGLSPADPAWEPLYQTLAEHGMAIILHAGSEQGFVDGRWAPPGDAGFASHAARLDQKIDTSTVDMFKLVTMQYGPQVLLSSLVLGGVLQRIPDLRIAVVELGADWVAPYVRMLDARVKEFAGFTGLGLLHLPSELLLRQVRFCPYHWEDVPSLLADPELYPLYAFSTDFPHSEGGQQTFPLADVALARFSESVRRSYFHDSAAAILR